MATTPSENYTLELAMALAKQLGRPDPRPPRKANPISAARWASRKTTPFQAAPRRPQLTAAEERAQRSAVTQPQANTGHAYNDALARAIRATGGPQRAIEMAPNLCCEARAARQRPLPRLLGRIKLDRDFNDPIGAELFILADYAGH